MNACAIAVGIATVICLTLIPPDEASASLYTPDMIANARRNIERYPWAQGQRDRAINRAKRWVALEDEALWRLVVGQDTPRCIDVTMTRGKRMGCINCGDDVFNFGNYPYKPDCLTMAWKIKCPSCDEIYPKNDFAAFYESALDEQGLFDVDLGDRSLLFNAEHPDPNDPLHEFGVDDGFGYHDDEGFEHRYIGYYGHSGLWVKLLSAARDLSGAYILTGEQIYAHKCAILLNRVADVYPDMDWAPYAERGWFHSDGGSNMGKIQGRIWETGTVSTLAEAYDRIKLGVADDDELFAFLAEKSTTCKLPTPVTDHESFCNHLDDHILREGANAVLNKQAWGNEGMHQSAMARCAIALDQEPET
ncbi:MAG TPA: heparinase, partial [Armatimonadota bacterium]|nr:heparinase [Armatimonadota bacterium]